MTGGLFDDLPGPLELQHEAAAPPPLRLAPLRRFAVLVPDARPPAQRQRESSLLLAGAQLTDPWRQVDEVLGRDLADAAATVALVRAWPRPAWTWPTSGVVIGARGRDRFAVIDPSIATVADLPTP